MNLTNLAEPELNLSRHDNHQSNGSISSELSKKVVDSQAVITALYALSGAMSIVFNGHVIALYIRFPRLRKIISPMLLQLFIYCLITGFINGAFVNILINLVYDIPSWWCVFSRLCIKFFSRYFALLIPALTIERYITIRNPLISKQNLMRFSIVSTVISTCTTCLIALFPYSTFLNPAGNATAVLHHLHYKGVNEAKYKYYRAFSCSNLLDILNPYSPIMELVLQAVCCIVVISLYVNMFHHLAKQQLAMWNTLTTIKKKRLRRAALHIMIVAGTFLLLTIPKGLLFEIASLCNNGWLGTSVCTPIRHKLILYKFSVISSFATVIAPAQFTLMRPKLRKALLVLYKKDTGANLSLSLST